MKQRWRYRVKDRLESWVTGFEDFWECHVRRRHREKFDSFGRCYRCGKWLR